MDIRYDVPFEVTEKQYKAVMKDCAGVCAGRVDEDGKFWLKLWYPKYKVDLIYILKLNIEYPA